MQCWAQVVENTEVIRYPEKEMNQIVNQLVADVEAYTQSVGINMNEYIQIRYGMTEEEFRANAAELAQNQMKEEMITYAIARAEKLGKEKGLTIAQVAMAFRQLHRRRRD